jgi:hypothetical protein
MSFSPRLLSAWRGSVSVSDTAEIRRISHFRLAFDQCGSFASIRLPPLAQHVRAAVLGLDLRLDPGSEFFGIFDGFPVRI